MQSFPHRMPAMALALLATLALPACAGGPRIVTIPTVLDCAGRIPPRLRADVQPAPLPSDNTVGGWVAFGDAQTGRLEAANDRKATVLDIVDHCQAEAMKAAKAVDTRPWWQKMLRPPKPG